VDDTVHLAYQWFESVPIANVAKLETVVSLEIRGPRVLLFSWALAVNLRFEIVEEDHLVAGARQRVREVRADKTGSTGYQDAFAH
jgi:hypothetical protein